MREEGKGRKEGDFVVLTDENGETHEFEVLDVLSVDGKEYAILAEPEDDEDAFALRIGTDGEGNEVLQEIEDDEEWEKVSRAWEEAQDELAGDEEDEDWEFAVDEEEDEDEDWDFAGDEEGVGEDEVDEEDDAKDEG